MRAEKIRCAVCSLLFAVAAPGTLLVGSCALELTHDNACQVFNCDTLFFLEDLLEGEAHADDDAAHDDDMDGMDMDDDHDE